MKGGVQFTLDRSYLNKIKLNQTQILIVVGHKRTPTVGCKSNGRKNVGVVKVFHIENLCCAGTLSLAVSSDTATQPKTLTPSRTPSFCSRIVQSRVFLQSEDSYINLPHT